jgi:hypothetical protein
MAQNQQRPGERVEDQEAGHGGPDRRVLKMAAEFIIEGLRCGEPAIIVASAMARQCATNSRSNVSTSITSQGRERSRLSTRKNY